MKKLELVILSSDQADMGNPFFEPLPEERPINRRWAGCLLGGMVCALALGCQVPRYQFPAGYSSTYSRHVPVEGWVASPPAELPPVECVSQAPGVFYPQTFKYEPPTGSEFQRTVVVLPEDRPARSQRY